MSQIHKNDLVTVLRKLACVVTWTTIFKVKRDHLFPLIFHEFTNYSLNSLSRPSISRRNRFSPTVAVERIFSHSIYLTKSPPSRLALAKTLWTIIGNRCHAAPLQGARVQAGLANGRAVRDMQTDGPSRVVSPVIWPTSPLARNILLTGDTEIRLYSN